MSLTSLIETISDCKTSSVCGIVSELIVFPIKKADVHFLAEK